MTRPYPPTGDELLEPPETGQGLCDGAGDDALEAMPRTAQSLGRLASR